MMDYLQEKNYILNLWDNQPRVASIILKSRQPLLYAKINELSGGSLSEKAWRWVNDTPSVCGYCQNSTKFLDFGRGYAKFCSRKCTANSKTVAEKKKNTNKQRYGVDHFSSTVEYKERVRQTCSDRYGVINPGQIDRLKTQRGRNKQLTFFNQLLATISEFATPNFEFTEYTHVRDKELAWTCVSCQTVFASNIFGKIPRCQTCYPTGNFGGQSSIEKDILSEIRKFYSGQIIENSRKIISPKELDLYFPKENFAIEVNGVYWHSEDRLEPNYHQQKYQQCADKGIKLLMVTDCEWAEKRELICRMIKHRLGITDVRIHARKCQVKKIHHRLAKSFLEKNHIHGHSRASICYGLYHNDSLLAVLTCMKGSRFNKKNSNIEIIRLAFDEYHVPGALGKFIRAIQQEHPNLDITTYADLRYGTGDVYTNNNFTQSHITKPGYWYFLNGVMYHRLSWTKKKLISLGNDPDKSESEIMRDMGALRIYDCGHKHFILRGSDE